jgi:hypothetical protein
MKGLGHKASERKNPARQPAGLSSAPPRCPTEDRISLTLRPDLRAVVCVAGSSSNAGKTTMCEHILRSLAAAGHPGFALKVTRTHIDACPRQNDGCGVCDDLKSPYRVVTQREELDVRRKDTGRYFAAGAAGVLWLIVDPFRMRDGVLGVLPHIPHGVLLVAEGNSFHDHTQGADLSLMAASDRLDIKPSAQHVLTRIDAFVGSLDACAAIQATLGSRSRPRPWIAPGDAGAFVVSELGL